MSLNTPGQADGSMAFWVDGLLALEQAGIEWRDTSELQLNKAWLQHYIAGGGADSSNRVWFDDMIVSTLPIGCGAAVGTRPRRRRRNRPLRHRLPLPRSRRRTSSTYRLSRPSRHRPTRGHGDIVEVEPRSRQHVVFHLEADPSDLVGRQVVGDIQDNRLPCPLGGECFL